MPSRNASSTGRASRTSSLPALLLRVCTGHFFLWEGREGGVDSEESEGRHRGSGEDNAAEAGCLRFESGVGFVVGLCSSVAGLAPHACSLETLWRMLEALSGCFGRGGARAKWRAGWARGVEVLTCGLPQQFRP